MIIFSLSLSLLSLSLISYSLCHRYDEISSKVYEDPQDIQDLVDLVQFVDKVLKKNTYMYTHFVHNNHLL